MLWRRLLRPEPEPSEGGLIGYRPPSGRQAETASVLDDLIRDSLRILLPVTLLVMWGWAAVVMVLDDRRIFPALGLFSLAAAGCWAGYTLQGKRLGLAVAAYLSALVATVTAIALMSPGSALLHLYVLIVPVAVVLAEPRVAWCLAAGCVGLVLAMGGARHLPFFWDLVTPVLLILMTALTSWLSVRGLHTALDWALKMTRESQRNAREARERRAEVRTVLKSLEEAYVRLERANQALIFAREAAEKAYRFKAEFVANVSHELRTPLNLIVGFSEMMATAPESYKGKTLPSLYRGDVMAIYRSACHLSDLIDDVLDLSQIEAGRMPLAREPADLGQVVAEAAEIVRGLAEAKGLRLEIDLPAGLPVLQLDRTRVRQVLLNLLTNATRFTDAGWIRTRAWVVGGEVRVTVEDSGRGIPAERIARAFEAFSQLGEDRAHEGSGLGLAVSRRFVELHGGRMWIESTLGQGTTVGFALPIAEGSEAARGLIRTRAPKQGGEGRPPVLVLHDDPHVITLLRRYVEGFGFVLADSVERARELLRETGALALIMEGAWRERWAEMAGSGGNREPLPTLTCPLPSLRQAGLLLGAVDYLVKPLRRGDLAAALARLPAPPRTVLVVDDDPNFARLLVRLLKAHDGSIEVLMASGGREGLAVARSRRPDLVLLDLLMPEVSGYDFLEEVRGDPDLGGMAVVIMSARSLELETRPLAGELSLGWPEGLTPTVLLEAIQGLLMAVTGPAARARASAAAPAADRPA